MGRETRGTDLSSMIERKIEYLLRELESLPAEYTPEAYGRWGEIRAALTGLYDIKKMFIDPRQKDEPLLETERWLY